jgi:hypothetical protein
MFMRYTHLGVGHPASLRRITRDSFGYGSPGNTMDDVINGDEADEDSSEGYEGSSDEEEGVVDEWFSDEELAPEDEGHDGGEGDDDDDDFPSF